MWSFVGCKFTGGLRQRSVTAGQKWTWQRYSLISAMAGSGKINFFCIFSPFKKLVIHLIPSYPGTLGPEGALISEMPVTEANT